MTNKYTSLEWAAIEGGHSIEPSEESFSFLKDIHEARMTRKDGDVRTLTYADCCERLYLSILMLEVMRQYPLYAGQAARYAGQSTSRMYDSFGINKTDLYNFIYFILGKGEALSKLKDPEAARRAKANTKLDVNALHKYLVTLSRSTIPNRVSEMLIRLESSLRITNTDYKAIRRQLTQFSSISLPNKKKVVTRLLIAARAKLRTSDLIDEFSKLAADNNLETPSVRDNEPTVSTPDMGFSARDASLYRYLVGTENVAMARKFLQLASQGRSVPNVMVQAYLPAIKMIDDIVQAGPSYVQRFRVLHQRAKKRQ